MSAVPLLEEQGGIPTVMTDSGIIGADAGQARRSLAIYPASAGFELVEELEYLGARAIEPNLFFNPRFLAPAMPRLEDREVRLAVIRDGDNVRTRLRLLVPFTIERAAPPFGTSILRAWSNPFGPLGTPLVDHDDPQGVIEDFFAMLSRPHLNMPRVFALPDVRLDGPFAAILGQFAETRGLPIALVNQAERPHLKSDLDGEEYLRTTLGGRQLRELRRQKRRLADFGKLDYVIARQPEEIRLAIETFLALEASGWKGRARTAMAVDRYRAAFVREASQRLAERDLCRVYELTLDGAAIASLVVFIESGVAYTWKTAYQEEFGSFSPGVLLMAEVTKSLLDDPNVEIADSCTVPDHPVMSRMWGEKRPLGTLVIGLTPDAGAQTRQAASQLHLYRNTRNAVRILRDRVKRALGRE
jgi:CelD/BcsL family acetyltransferase involved in cellulose biosynthesis